MMGLILIPLLIAGVMVSINSMGSHYRDENIKKEASNGFWIPVLGILFVIVVVAIAAGA